MVSDRIVQDTRIALRALRRNPTFTATAVAILGVAIGMAAAMWTVFNAVVLRPLPVRDQDAIVVPSAFDQSGVEIALSGAEFRQLQHEMRTLRDVAGFAHWGAFAFPLVGRDGQSVVLASSQVTGNFFRVLGAQPLLGRLLQPSDDVQGAAPVMVISFSTWQRQFGGDPAVIGQVLTDPGQQIAYSIVGVAPPGLDYPLGAECWTAASIRGSPYVSIVGRLAPGSSIVAARSEFAAFAQHLDRDHPEHFHPVRFQATTLATAVVGDVRPILVVLTAAVGLLLLIACVNVATLLLMRAAIRSRELAIRGALGATYGAIVRLLLTESALLGIAGGVLGLGCAEALRRRSSRYGAIPARPRDWTTEAEVIRGNAVASGKRSCPHRSRWPLSCWRERHSWAARCNGWSNSTWGTTPATCLFSSCRFRGPRTIRCRRYCSFMMPSDRTSR